MIRSIRTGALRPPHSRSIRGRVMVFVAVACLLALAMMGHQTLQDRDNVIRVSRLQTTNLSESLAQQVTDSFQAVDAVLFGLTERVETDGIATPRLRRLHAVMQAQVRALPVLHNLFIVSANGDGLSNALPIKNAKYLDRAWFVYHRTHADRGTHIGPAVRSRTDGSWIITASRRLSHRDGSFAGVMLATIQVHYFEHLYGGVDVGTLGIIDLTLADGTILVRKPFDGAGVGKSLAKARWFRRDLPHKTNGTYESRSVIDGIPRFYAFRRVARYPLLIVVGLAQDEALAAWRLGAWFDLAEVATVVVILLALGNYLVGQIWKREAAESELGRLALVDALTELGNRRRFDFELDREWRRAVRARSSFAFLMIDVDEFKAYNDRYGHRAGDRALKAIASCIAANVTRSEDLAARYGGEEFAVLLPATDVLGAYQVAETIRRAVVALGIAHAGDISGFVTVSIGAASARPERGSSPSTIVEAADTALYDAKRNGRNRSDIVRRPGAAHAASVAEQILVAGASSPPLTR